MRARISRRSGAGAQRGSPSCGRLRGTSPPPLLEPADLPYPDVGLGIGSRHKGSKGREPAS
jgi:hypothetical protein